MTHKSVVLTVGGGNSPSKDRCEASRTETILTICISMTYGIVGALHRSDDCSSVSFPGKRLTHMGNSCSRPGAS